VKSVAGIVAENGTYRLVSGSFDVTQRASSTGPRPLPYTPALASTAPVHACIVDVAVQR
jgi:hypothetical protein